MEQNYLSDLYHEWMNEEDNNRKVKLGNAKKDQEKYIQEVQRLFKLKHDVKAKKLRECVKKSNFYGKCTVFKFLLINCDFYAALTDLNNPSII